MAIRRILAAVKDPSARRLTGVREAARLAKGFDAELASNRDCTESDPRCGSPACVRAAAPQCVRTLRAGAPRPGARVPDSPYTNQSTQP